MTVILLKDFEILIAMGCFTDHFSQGTMNACFDSIKGGGYFCFSPTEKVKQSFLKRNLYMLQKNSTLVDFTEPMH